jgi:hypothetical protein
MTHGEVTALVGKAAAAGRILGVRLPLVDEDEEPWAAPPSRRRQDEPIDGNLPGRVELVLGNQIYLDRKRRFGLIVFQLDARQFW